MNRVALILVICLARLKSLSRRGIFCDETGVETSTVPKW